MAHYYTYIHIICAWESWLSQSNKCNSIKCAQGLILKKDCVYTGMQQKLLIFFNLHTNVHLLSAYIQCSQLQDLDNDS